MYRFILTAALLPMLALADEPAPDWKAEIDLGRKAIAAHDYRGALDRFLTALKLTEGSPDATAGQLESLRGAARASLLQGNLENAEQFLTSAAAAAQKECGESSPELASALSDLAGVQRSRGEREQAIASLEKAVAIRAALPEGKPEDLAKDLAGLGLLQVATGGGDKAKETLQRALAAWETAAGPDSPQLLPVLDALGGVHRSAAEYTDAEPVYLRALVIREASLGPESSELLSTLDSLAYVYFGQQKFAEAEPVYRRLLALWESSAGPDHPMVALTLDKMAEFYAFQQRYAEAETAATQALALRTNQHLASLNQVGRILIMEAKIDEAGDLYSRSIQIGDLAKASDAALDPLLRIEARILRETDHPKEADALDKRVKDALIRKGDREGRRPSPVKLQQ